MAKENIQTTQRTSKVWKLAMLFGGVLFFGSCAGVMTSNDPRTGANFLWGVILGAVILGGARLLAWWNHG